MEKHIHINIGRQIGAGGLDVARELGKRFNIKVYDKELLTLAAKESGLDHSVFAKEDEKDNLSLNTGFSLSSFAEVISNTFKPSVYNRRLDDFCRKVCRLYPQGCSRMLQCLHHRIYGGPHKKSAHSKQVRRF